MGGPNGLGWAYRVKAEGRLVSLWYEVITGLRKAVLRQVIWSL